MPKKVDGDWLLADSGWLAAGWLVLAGWCWLANAWLLAGGQAGFFFHFLGGWHTHAFRAGWLPLLARGSLIGAERHLSP